MIGSPGTLRKALTYGTRAERTIAMDVANLTRLKARSLDIESSEATIASLFEAHKPATVRTYASAVINLLRASGREGDRVFKDWKKALARTHKATDEQYGKSALTDRQRANWVSWDDLVEARKRLAERTRAIGPGPLKPGQRAAVERHLLMSLFTLLPPRRNEYGTVEFVAERKRHKRVGNYYMLGADAEDYIVLNDYKTAKSHGREVIKVPDELVTVVRRSLELFPRTHMFAGRDGTGAAGNAYINRLFKGVVPGKTLGSGIVRKIAKTTWEDLKLPQAHRLAKRMGHSLGTAEQFYNGSATRDPNEKVDNPMGFDV
jgi:hypothetical protein